jgi:hypothetical protein
VEGQFTNEDKVSIKDGKISGQLYWKHTTLFGKDYDWQFDYDFTGYKRLKNPDALKFGMIYGFPVGHKMVKYDGKLLSEGNTNLGADIFGADSAAGLYLTVPDSDSCWDESIPPNNDEVKVERNGWKAVATNGTRYALWRSKVDGSFPSGAYQTTTSTTGNGVTNITVPDGTQFTIGDFIAVMHAGQLLVGTSLRITNIVGNVLYLGTSINVSNGDLVVKGDNTGTGSTALLTWCKNNVAPGYAGDALHYKLANPEPITDVNTHIEGEIWSLQPGDNYLDIESGMILGEVATPVAYNNGYYYINHTFDVLKADLLRNQAELITKIYRNTVDDTSKWVIWSNLSSVENNVYGKSRAEISASNYYINATYTVDYQILKTLIAQGFGSLSMRYAQDVFTAVSEAVTALESKQRHDSALDTLVDLSMYERITRPYSWYLNTVNIGSTLFANVFIPIARKKVIPKVTIEKIEIWGCANGLANKITQFLTISELEVTKDYINITYQTSDATTISNAKTYGVFARNVVIAADCNGRV